MFTKEMMKALEADGEKLRQLTGEDHGPEFFAVDTRCRYVVCERCGGTGEVEVRPTVGPYEDPTPHAELCSVCDGYGMDCVETDAAGEDHIEAEEVARVEARREVAGDN